MKLDTKKALADALAIALLLAAGVLVAFCAAASLPGCKSLPDGNWEPMPDPIPPAPGDDDHMPPMPPPDDVEPAPSGTPCERMCLHRVELGCRPAFEACFDHCERSEREAVESRAPGVSVNPACQLRSSSCAEAEACRGGAP